MNRRIALWTAALAAALIVAPPARAADAPTAEAPKVKTVTLHVFHRIFQNFQDRIVTPMKTEFRIGDSEYTGRVEEFVPDFAMDIQKHKVISRSNEPKNPAFRILVRKNGVPRDTVWAFFNLPPHFAPKSEIGFVATEIQFVNRPPLASRDSVAVRMREQEKEHDK